MLNSSMHNRIPGLFMVKDGHGTVKAGMMLPCCDEEPASVLTYSSSDSYDELCKIAQEFWPEGRVLFSRNTSLKGKSVFIDSDYTERRNGIIRLGPAYIEKNASIEKTSLSKGEEFEEWKKYKDGDKKALNSLVRSFKPLVYSRVKPWLVNSPLPKSAVKAEGMRLLKMGFDTYDPSKGAALNTHVWNYLSKIHRYGYTYQNVGSLPEPRAAKVGTYQNTFEQMKDDLGREPTLQELHQELGWKISDLKAIKEELRADLSLDKDIGPIFASSGDPAIEALMATYYDADTSKKLIMEYTFDEFKGKDTIKGVAGIASALDIKPVQVRKAHRDIHRSMKSILDSGGPSSLSLSGAFSGK